MLTIRLDNFGPLINATSQLSRIAEKADVKLSPSKVSIIISHPSLRFIVKLQISRQYFTHYSVDQNRSARISLQSFHDVMFSARTFSSMTIQLPGKTLTRMILRFSTSRLPQQVRHEIILSPSEEEDVEEVEYVQYFSIASRNLRRVLNELPLLQDASNSVCVTMTNLQVKFSLASNEVILTTEDGQCEIKGYKGEFEIQFQIILHPVQFFLDLTYDTHKIWFYKTSSHGIMIVPTFAFDARYVFYFPQM